MHVCILEIIKIPYCYFLVEAGTVVLYDKTTITEMNSTGSSASTVSDEEFGTVNYEYFSFTIFTNSFFYLGIFCSARCSNKEFK